MSEAEQSPSVELVAASELSSQVRLLSFRFRQPEGLSWQPGQYTQLSEPSAPLVRIPLSIASAPDPKRPGYFEVAVKRRDDFLRELSPGAVLQAAAPDGQLVRPAAGESALLVAMGTGLAPLRALLQQELGEPAAGSAEPRVALLYGARTQADLLWHRELSQWQDQHARFDYHPTLSQADAAWSGRSGRVQAHLAELLGALQPQRVYLCGSTEMVDQSTELLRSELGFDPERIVRERYG